MSDAGVFFYGKIEVVFCRMVKKRQLEDGREVSPLDSLPVYA